MAITLKELVKNINDYPDDMPVYVNGLPLKYIKIGDALIPGDGYGKWIK